MKTQATDTAGPNDIAAQAEERFFRYYAEQSMSQSALQRFESTREVVLRIRGRFVDDSASLDVADVGCNAGTQCIIWARAGHRVHGIDINDRLLQLAARRARESDLEVDFKTASATDLPWRDESMDICLVPELLEHVADWRKCLEEFTRVLRPGGVLYLSTTNWLCPVQQEFNLPFYSWYPSPLKRHYERLAIGARPEIANNAKFPAVNWFSYYGLRAELRDRGFMTLDRFDVMDTRARGATARLAIGAIRAFALLRWVAHVATPYTLVIAIKDR